MKKAQDEANREAEIAQRAKYLRNGYQEVMNSLNAKGVKQMVIEGVLVPTNKEYEV